MTPFALAMFLFAVAAGLLVAEVLLPTHGVLGIMAVLATVAGVIVCYQVSHALAFYVALGITVAAPFGAALWVKLWPKTPIGRRMVLGPVRSRREEQADDFPAVGETGVVVAELRPNGLCEFAGERFEARSERGVLPAGRRVRVIAVVDGRPTVRPV